VAKHEAQVAAEPTYDPDFEGFDFVLEHFQSITKPLSFASELDRLIRVLQNAGACEDRDDQRRATRNSWSRFDLAILEERALRARGTAAKAQAECRSLSKHKRKYILGLLEIPIASAWIAPSCRMISSAPFLRINPTCADC
jgi:hypothetical protein